MNGCENFLLFVTRFRAPFVRVTYSCAKQTPKCRCVRVSNSSCHRVVCVVCSACRVENCWNILLWLVVLIMSGARCVGREGLRLVDGCQAHLLRSAAARFVSCQSFWRCVYGRTWR